MAATRGTRSLTAAGVAFTLHRYDYDPDAERIGLAAARTLGLDPALMLKTLMVEVDGRPACCVIPAGASLSMKKVAVVFGGKGAAMMPPARAERLTGYHVGGISPFGMQRPAPVVIEAAPCDAGRIWINAGQRGLLVALAPVDAIRVLDARTAALTA